MSEGTPEVRMLPAGECGLVVEMGNEISPKINARVQRLAKRISQEIPEGVIEVVPTYRSLLVHFDPLTLQRRELARTIERMLGAETASDTARKDEVRIVHVPVCYGGEFGPDLDFVAEHNGLGVDEVVAIHSSRPYLVYMLGFTPGFPYLGGMSGRIATPRLEKPRAKIPQGSVGIAGAQTGLYPVDSPGGWRLIGRTPLKPFVPGSANPFLFSAGDYLRFIPISPEQYHSLRQQVDSGAFEPEIHISSPEDVADD